MICPRCGITYETLACPCFVARADAERESIVKLRFLAGETMGYLFGGHVYLSRHEGFALCGHKAKSTIPDRDTPHVDVNSQMTIACDECGRMIAEARRVE